MKTFFLISRLGRAAGILLLCSVWLDGVSMLGGTARMDNVYVLSNILPATLQRVLVLPLAHEDSSADSASGCETLTPVLMSELIKTKKFEVVAANPRTVQELSGQPAWTGAEVLPPDFLSSLQRIYGCDAVLFCQLSAFHPYPPLVIGWRMKLVDVSTGKILWAADMIFDAGDPAVSKSAQDYQKRQQGAEKPATFLKRVWIWLNRQPEPATDDQWTILNSPRYFGEFTASALLETLPQR